MRFIKNIIDSFKPFDKEMVLFYQHKLPSKILVRMNFDKSRKEYWAKIIIDENSKDAIYTKAKSRSKLEENVNDAVVTYYEVPYKYAKHLLINKHWRDPELIDEMHPKTA